MHINLQKIKNNAHQCIAYSTRMYSQLVVRSGMPISCAFQIAVCSQLTLCYGVCLQICRVIVLGQGASWYNQSDGKLCKIQSIKQTSRSYNQWGILLFLVSLLFFVRVLLQLTKIGKVVIMLTLFGKLLFIVFCGDYATNINSFWN